MTTFIVLLQQLFNFGDLWHSAIFNCWWIWEIIFKVTFFSLGYFIVFISLLFWCFFVVLSFIVLELILLLWLNTRWLNSWLLDTHWLNIWSLFVKINLKYFSNGLVFIRFVYIFVFIFKIRQNFFIFTLILFLTIYKVIFRINNPFFSNDFRLKIFSHFSWNSCIILSYFSVYCWF